MSDPEGKFQVVKNRLNDYVVAAIGGQAFNDWKVETRYLGTYPIGTLRLPSIELTHETYGRSTPETGRWGYYYFSVFIHDERDDTYGVTVPDHYKAMDDADSLITYLLGIRGNTTEKSTYGIYWIDELRIDERSPSRSPRDMATVSVSGRIMTKWEDI